MEKENFQKPDFEITSALDEVIKTCDALEKKGLGGYIGTIKVTDVSGETAGVEVNQTTGVMKTTLNGGTIFQQGESVKFIGITEKPRSIKPGGLLPRSEVYIKHTPSKR